MTDHEKTYEAERTNELVHRVMLDLFESARDWVTAEMLQEGLLEDPDACREISRIARALEDEPATAASHIRGHWNQHFTRELNGHAKYPAYWSTKWVREKDGNGYKFWPVASVPPPDSTEPEEDRSSSKETKVSGPGALTPAQRLAIENRAYALARLWIHQQGWTVVEEPRPGRPYDLGCRDGAGRVRNVEVKGTCSQGDAVMITRREKELARQGELVLFIAGCLRKDGQPHASETYLALDPWPIDDGVLEGVTYRWALPTDKSSPVNASALS